MPYPSCIHYHMPTKGFKINHIRYLYCYHIIHTKVQLILNCSFITRKNFEVIQALLGMDWKMSRKNEITNNAALIGLMLLLKKNILLLFIYIKSSVNYKFIL